jgi:hypothetical protein
MSTPPILGLMALRINAVFIVSCPTMAVNGKMACIGFLELFLSGSKQFLVAPATLMGSRIP